MNDVGHNSSESPWAQQLAALHHAGAAQRAPVRWHQLSALARRTQAAPADVQAVLAPKLAERLNAWLVEVGQSGADGPAVKAPTATTSHTSPLAALNHYLRAATEAKNQASPAVGTGLMPDTGLPGDSPSVLRFRETWAHIAAETQVARAVARAPEHAGPLNSHMLVLRSLSLMQDLSPDYLRRFLSQVDTLLWLEKASPLATTEAKPTRRKTVKKHS